METTKVGIREFRNGLAEYIAASHPVPVTRHGQTLGYFTPTQGQADAELAALRKAGKVLDQLFGAHRVNEADVVAEIKVARQRAGRKGKARARHDWRCAGSPVASGAGVTAGCERGIGRRRNKAFCRLRQ